MHFIYKSDPEFYAPDLIELILNLKTRHEIGCHSFSHCNFDEAYSTPELIEAEINACQLQMTRFGIQPESFVFPGNQPGHFSLLEKYGYRVLRFKKDELKEVGFPKFLSDQLLALHDSMSIERFAADQLEIMTMSDIGETFLPPLN